MTVTLNLTPVYRRPKGCGSSLGCRWRCSCFRCGEWTWNGVGMVMPSQVLGGELDVSALTPCPVSRLQREMIIAAIEAKQSAGCGVRGAHFLRYGSLKEKTKCRNNSTLTFHRSFDCCFTLISLISGAASS